MQRRGWKRVEGQAAGEMSVLMVAIIPAFLYVLFADELNRHKLDLQEAVVASPWDYAFLNYESAVPSGALNAHHEAAFANHSSSHPGSLGGNGPPGGANLFTAPIWGIEGEVGIVRCETVTSEGFSLADAMATNFKNRFQKGGKVTCTAQKGVENHYLIPRFMHEWSGMELSSKGVRSAYISPSGLRAFTWPLARQYFSIVTDSWALTSRNAVDPNYLPSSLHVGGIVGGMVGSALGGAAGLDACGLGANANGDPFYMRMFSIFCQGNGRSTAVAEANKIVAEANDAEFLQSHLRLDSVMNLGGFSSIGGDNTGTPTLAFFPDSQGDVKLKPSEGRKFHHSPWTNRYQQAHSARNHSYMGKNLPQ